MSTKKYVFYSTTLIKESINFKKLGIVIRNINPEEKKLLVKNYREIIFSEEDLDTVEKAFKYLDSPTKLNVKETKKDENEDKFLDFLKFSEQKRDIAIVFYKNAGKEYKISNLSELEKKISKLKIIEINHDVFCNLFNKERGYKIVNNLIVFPFYLNNLNLELENIKYKLDYEPQKLENKIYDFDEIKVIKEGELAINSMFFDSFNLSSKFRYNDLVAFANFLNSNDSDFNFKFMLMIDKINQESIFHENKIISLISVIESLLISKSSNKSKDFTLKVGTILKLRTSTDNHIIKKQLDLIYQTRNSIVHGTEEQIESAIEKYKNVFGNIIEKGKSKFETRNNILIVVRVYIELYICVILQYYLENPELINYQKICDT